MPFSLRLPSFLKPPHPRFSFRIPWPVLTAAEKTALVALLLVLSCGGALRLWERSGVSIGPVDDWESLRALVIQAREHAKQEGQGAGYPCLDEGPGMYPRGTGGGGGAPGMTTLLAAGTAGVLGEATGKGTGKAPGGKKGGAGKKAPARSVDLNTAGERALLSLPGVGPSTAKAILAHRAAHGRFRTVDDLLQVKGIGPKKLEALRPYVRVEMKVEAKVEIPAEIKTGPEPVPQPPEVSPAP